MIAQAAAFDMIAQHERELNSAPMLNQDATDSSENADPMLSTEPTDPMLRMLPADPILAIESTDLREAYESEESFFEVRLATLVTLLRDVAAELRRMGEYRDMGRPMARFAHIRRTAARRNGPNGGLSRAMTPVGTVSTPKGPLERAEGCPPDRATRPTPPAPPRTSRSACAAAAAARRAART